MSRANVAFAASVDSVDLENVLRPILHPAKNRSRFDSRRAMTITSDHPTVVRTVWRRGFWILSWWCWRVERARDHEVLESGTAWTMDAADRIAKHWAKVYDARIACGNHWQRVRR